MLEGIGMWTMISASKYHVVPLIKFNANLMKRVVTAAMEDQEWQDAINATKDNNPSTNLEYLYMALYYKGRL
jgi:hypothetical protein